jgi:hypothetical protein
VSGTELARVARWLARVGAVGLTAHSLVNAVLLRVPPVAATIPERVSVLIPARNEEDRIGRCLQAVLASRQLPALEVLVLDDDSTDETADLVRAFAGADRRLRLLPGTGNPPPGWLGKPWACARLAAAADPRSTVLVFLDADVELAPDGLARTVRLLREAELGFVSPYPRQLAVSAAERLVQPLLQWSWLTLLPLRFAEHSPRPSLAVANGQLLAVDAQLYRRSGGHEAVAGAVLEDIAIARALRACGAHGGLADGTTVASCRMYTNWSELRDGYAKSLWAAAGGSRLGTVAQVGLLTLLYCRPDPVAYLAGVLGRVITASRTGGRILPDAFAHPVSIAGYAMLSALSWWRRDTGMITWKGRTLPPAAASGVPGGD